ncbi:NAD(P)-dependent oxidoreductase [Taklimakanibacter deserti]|uniref:NAD(P)-dependent oxidoreductase n=1 Tax=Taklimakanibacter deserti TaxID=2267839 RepID=UPI000E656ABA
MRIGFVGLGLMGSGMAGHLMERGHELWLMAHRNRSFIDPLLGKGAHEAKDLGTLAKESEVIILCLTTAKVVEETILGLMPHLRRGQIIIDTGTTDPQTTRRLARELKVQGVAYADAPMAGGPEQVAKKEVGALIGADEQTFAAIAPLVSCYASRLKHFGPPGSGHVAKLISNYLVIGMIGLVTEAFTTARKAQVDWKDLYEVMLNGSGNSGVLRKMMEAALAGDFDGYKFSLTNAAKDIGYYSALAQELEQLTPLTEAVEQIFAKAVATGHGGRNVSHLLDPAIDDVT